MAAVQRNFKWYRYVDEDGRNWGIRADQDAGDIAAFGLTAFNSADPPFGPQSRLHHPRKRVYVDATTFRKRVVIVGTSAAQATVPLTMTVSVPGETATVTYDKSVIIAEKLQVPGASRQLIDHA
jgi:hypothetical protein